MVLLKVENFVKRMARRSILDISKDENKDAIGDMWYHNGSEVQDRMASSMVSVKSCMIHVYNKLELDHLKWKLTLVPTIIIKVLEKTMTHREDIDLGWSSLGLNDIARPHRIWLNMSKKCLTH